MRINRRLINSTKGISSKLRVFILVILCSSVNFSRLASIINAWRNPAVMGSRYLVQWVLRRSWNFDRSLQRLSRRKLAWFGQVTRHDSLSKTILQDTLEGGRHRGRERKFWMDTKEGTSHARTAHKDLLQKRLREDLCWIVPHVPPTTQSVKTPELNWAEILSKSVLREGWSLIRDLFTWTYEKELGLRKSVLKRGMVSSGWFLSRQGFHRIIIQIGIFWRTVFSACTCIRSHGASSSCTSDWQKQNTVPATSCRNPNKFRKLSVG